jgi:hypothetical protein
VGKVLLSHMCGAPWNDKKPEAFLHSLQVETLARREREQLVHGGSRLGKSVIGGAKLCIAATRVFRNIHVVAGSYNHVGKEWQYLFRGMKVLFAKNGGAFPRLTFKNSMNYYSFDLKTIWGTEGVGVSTDSDDGAALLGTASTDMVLGEGSHISPETWERRCVRALDGATMSNPRAAEIEEMGSSTIATTPKGFQGASASEWERVMKQTQRHPERLHYKAVPWVETVWIREASVLENPDYQTAVFDARALHMTKAAHDEQYRGRMTFASGRVLHAFDEDRHLVRRPTDADIRKMRLGVGIDTGAFTSLELLGLAPDKRLFFLGETYTKKESLNSTLDQFKAMLVERLGSVFETHDWKELLGYIDILSVDPASQVKFDLQENLGVGLTGPNTADNKSVLQTLNRMNEWLEEDRLLIVEEACPDLVDQIKKYVWKITKAVNKSANTPTIREPTKENDHCIDAARFGAIMLEPCGPLETSMAPKTFKEEYDSMQRERFVGPLREMLEEARMWE